VQSPACNDSDRSGTLLESESELACVELDSAIEVGDLIAHDRIVCACRAPNSSPTLRSFMLSHTPSNREPDGEPK
jgi:hypothetical protein